jgi:cytochrome b pre-mRNA-processing protein 3
MSLIPNWFASTDVSSRTAGEIYGSIVASARQSTFYAAWGVPDSREGRFEMLALHIALVMRRIVRAGPQGPALSRAISEAFVVDMDDNMREIGIGDLAVPRKVKKAAAALYDRHRDYGAALDAGDSAALTAAINAALTAAGATDGLDSAAMAGYTERLWGALRVTSDQDCVAGALPLPYPATPHASD